jgi:phage-related protein
MDNVYAKPPKPLVWVGSSLKDLRRFPEEVKDEMGYALYEAQCGLTPLCAKPLSGFGGAQVVEIVASYRSDAYRTVYTVKFEGVVYVLHAFQKKSKKGVKTPQTDAELILKRLKQAEILHRMRRS